ncbi:sigma-70 family RNA polymerase sigma factor [Aeoliella sp.]|uniref:sigma-70 family RNA polymerase sigma factor n=1 Tax=Aeoliella sp. TaxID=2795800 RepID=UPI003CCBAB8A
MDEPTTANNMRATESPDAWVERYGDMLFRVAISRIADRSAAEDVVQEAFLAAWKSRDNFDGRSARGTWLVAILHRKIADHFRRAGRLRETPTGGDSDAASSDMFDEHGIWRRAVSEIAIDPNSPAERSEFWTSLQHCIQGLPATMSVAFQMREVEAEPIEETCQRLGITRQNLAVRLHRARLLLRECLQGKWLGSRESNP